MSLERRAVATTTAATEADEASTVDTYYATDTESEPEGTPDVHEDATAAINVPDSPSELPQSLDRVALLLGNFKRFPSIAAFPENRRYLVAPPSHLASTSWKGAFTGDVVGPLLALQVGQDMYDPLAGWVLGSSDDDSCDLRLSKDNRSGISRKHLRFDFELSSKSPRITLFSRNPLRILVHQAARDRVVILQKGQSLTVRDSAAVTLDFGWHSFQAWCPTRSPHEERQYSEHVEHYFDDCLNAGGNTLDLKTPSGAETALMRQGKNDAVYMAGECLGNGSVSVRLVREINSGKYYAAKEPRWRSTDSASTVLGRWEEYKAQYAVLKTLQHPHVVEVIELLLDKKQPPWLIMEYVPDDLDAVLVRLGPHHRRLVLSQLLQAVAHIHARGFIHLDIKPANILLQCAGDEPVVKLADVDTTRTTDNIAAMATFVGTPVYMAPEIWRHEGPSGKPTDMWAVGLVALQLFTTWRPEHDTSWVHGSHGIAHNELGHDVWIRDVLMPHMATAPPSTQPLLEALIRSDPKTRWTAEQSLSWLEQNAESWQSHKRKRDSFADEGRPQSVPRDVRSEAPSFSSELAEWARANIPVVWVPPPHAPGSTASESEQLPAGAEGSPSAGTPASQAVPPWRPMSQMEPDLASGATTPTGRASVAPSPSLPDTAQWESFTAGSPEGAEQDRDGSPAH